MSTHMITLYLDICKCLHLNRYGIFNVHLPAVSVHKRHTDVVIFYTAAKYLDVLCPPCKYSIIGVSTYGKRKITGRISVVLTRFQNIAKPGFIRIWCGSHQLEIVLQSAYSKFGNEPFYTQLMDLISYLWCQ